MKKEVIAHKNPKSPISEIFRTLRTNIQFMNVNKKLKVLLVTSTFPGEGKSWTASNLAVTFAQAGKRVVLIDSDMRKGRLYSVFGISPKPGLSNFLSEAEVNETTGELSKDVADYIQATEVDNLYVMSAGSVPPNPSELLVSIQMKLLLKELRSLSDIIIIDGTPSELVTDSVILSRIADSTVIVTAYKMTKKDALARVIKNIKNVGGNIAGVVINRMPVSYKRYGERYYYYGHDNNKSKNGRKNKKSNESLKSNTFTKISQNNLNNNDNIYGKDRVESTSNNSLESYIKDSINSMESYPKDSNNSIENYPKDIDNSIENYPKDSNNIKIDDNQNTMQKTESIINQINSFLEQEKNQQ